MAATLALVVIAGCGRRTPDYTPSLQTATDALRRGLQAWKDGLAAGEVRGSANPLIHVTDTGRKPGQTLTDYRILGETPGSAGRTFAVTLQLANPVEEIRTRYIVVGIDPLWVFRQEDYELLMHWDHHMPPVDASSDPGAPADALEQPR
jgi:hypothetical protein